MSGMRKLREKRHNRVYHPISRIAHRSFSLDADERDRCHMRPTDLRGMPGIASCSHFSLRHLSPLAKAGYVELADGGNKSSCRSAYRLTRKGRGGSGWAFCGPAHRNGGIAFAAEVLEFGSRGAENGMYTSGGRMRPASDTARRDVSPLLGGLRLGDCARICAHGRSQVSENMVKYHHSLASGEVMVKYV